MKFKQKKSSNSMLSDKIADALTVKARADIEDDQVFGTKPQTVSRADFSSSESEDDAVISDFRKRNVNLLSDISKKYEGEVVSTKKSPESEPNGGYEESDSDDEGNTISAKNLFLNDEITSTEDESEDEKSKSSNIKDNNSKVSDSEESEGESDDYSITNFQKDSKDRSEESESDDDNDDDNEEENGEGMDISQLEEAMKEEFQHVKKQNVSEEAQKGGCVRNQLLVWEGLLEMRIHLQRCMNTANQMPMPEKHQELAQDNEFAEECNNAKTNISNVLDKFLTLQSLLFKNFPETKSISSKKHTTDEPEKKEDSDEEIPSDTDNEEIPSDTEEEDVDSGSHIRKPDKSGKSTQIKKRKLEDYEKEIATSHKAFKTFRDSTIQKWNDKTRLATASNIKNTPTNTVLQQISYILSDKEKLIHRTQLKRSEYDIVGYEPPVNEKNGTDDNTTIRNRKDDDEYLPEIFDDSDFYHQLLRELIECKSADISDPVQLSRQWIALQQMRSKMKRKVDTKATKGRKIKYVVHNQLVNFMAPEKSNTWTDESTNELYSSLFGKLFEHNNVGVNSNMDNIFKIKN